MRVSVVVPDEIFFLFHLAVVTNTVLDKDPRSIKKQERTLSNDILSPINQYFSTISPSMRVRKDLESRRETHLTATFVLHSNNCGHYLECRRAFANRQFNL